MAKLNFDLKGIKIESAATWAGAFMLALGVTFTAFSVIRYFGAKAEKKLKIELNEQTRIALYEQIPHNDVTPDVAFVDQITKSDVPHPGAASKAKTNPHSEWSYLGESGPSYWAMLNEGFRLCGKGEEQSPVNLKVTQAADRPSTLQFLYRPSLVELSHNGRFVSAVPERGSLVTAFNQSYELERMEFHVPAEHRIGGTKYDLEIQLYHRGPKQQKLAIAILAQEGAREHAGLQPLIPHLPTHKSRPTEIQSYAVDRLLPGSEQYFSYDGSLTSPPCTEKLRWVVFKSPISVSAKQIDDLLSVTKFNARPLQNLGKRMIYGSQP